MWAPVLVALCLLAAWGGALPSRVPASARPIPGGRIIGGEPVNISQFPWQVSVLKEGLHYCGGSIISSEWVLTAAHCIEDGPRQWYKVRAGSSKWGEGGTVYSADDLILHEDYSLTPVDNDIGLIKIRGTIWMSDKVKTVNLATFEPEAGTRVTVTGWGATETESTSCILLAVTVEILERSSCNTTYIGNITESMICAAVEGGGKDSCTGDSGGPLVAGNTQYGIVSWATGCAQPEYPGVYTSVAALLSWIREKTGV